MESDRRKLLARAGVLAGAALAGCTGRSVDDVLGGRSNGEVLGSDLERETPDVPKNALETLVRGNTAFALDCFQTLVDASPSENLLVSPYSVSLAMAMVWAGARGRTERQIKETLRYQLDQDELHPVFNALDRRLEEQPGASDTDATPFQLSVVNAIWGQTEYPFRDSYLDSLARNYGAGLRTLDFSSHPDRSRTRINEWVSDQTNGTIEQLFEQESITAATRIVLANAVYFKADWKHPFSADATEDGPFTALDGSTSTVPMMSQTAQFPAAEIDGHRLVELPYAGGGVGLVVVLPAEGAFESFERSLDPGRLETFIKRLEPVSAAITLPRFTDESQIGLKRTLSALGMASAFDANEADFSGMVDSENADAPAIDDVVHKTHIAVDEEGTEASAATGVTMPVSAPTREFELTVDRPFLYAIRERTTGTVLFLGRVVDAGAAQ